MAPVARKLHANPNFEVKICITAQHRNILDQVLNIFDIIPDFDLNIMQPGQTLQEITSKVLEGLTSVLSEWQPDIVLVHGDTTTAFAASLASFYQKIPVGHVEAGLRTGDIYSPWPEEANRKLISSLAYLNFAPTENARLNLLKEGIASDRIIVTGNTVIDALLMAKKQIDDSELITKKLSRFFPMLSNDNRFILVTAHRRENFGKGFEMICSSIAKISKIYSDLKIIYPVHPNPNVREPVKKILSGYKNIHLVEPLDYLPFVYLLSKATLVLTDSGGIQEEAPSLGKPVLVMRDNTERPEAVSSGTAKLVGTRVDSIVSSVKELLSDEAKYKSMTSAHNPYGNGKASDLIIDKLLNS